MARFTAVMLDVDGTLINTIDLAVRTLGEALAGLTGCVPPEEALRSSMHLPTLGTAAAFHPADPDLLAARWMEGFRSRFGENYLYEGVREGLAGLREAGFRLAAVTSETREELDHTLAFFGLDSYFDATVAVDEVPRRKPAPDSLLKGLELLGAGPHEALYLGDSPTDLQASRAAGLPGAAAL
ncbi:MAG: HAD family hydrolase, partial [Chitinophagales bacterium]